MYSSHGIWLIVTGFILLLAMVGTIVITIKTDSSQEISDNNVNLYTSPNSEKHTSRPSKPSEPLWGKLKRGMQMIQRRAYSVKGGASPERKQKQVNTSLLSSQSK